MDVRETPPRLQLFHQGILDLYQPAVGEQLNVIRMERRTGVKSLP
jgi:hypothetical protein